MILKEQPEIVFRADAFGKHITNAICSDESSRKASIQSDVGIMKVVSVHVYVLLQHTDHVISSQQDAHFFSS